MAAAGLNQLSPEVSDSVLLRLRNHTTRVLFSQARLTVKFEASDGFSILMLTQGTRRALGAT
jgi:hypothetical protein